MRAAGTAPPAAVDTAGGALDDEQVRPGGVAGQHDLAGADPAGAPDQQPVTGTEGGLHGAFGDGDAG
jgi:hypothetical protein